MRKQLFFAFYLVLALLSTPYFVAAQTTVTDTTTSPKPEQAAPKKKAWYELMKAGGYTQVRYNRLLETNPNLKCDQCDKSIGDKGGIFIRRARLKFSGQVHERVFFYIQADFASNAATSASSTGINFLQTRDAYFDLGLDKKSEFRIRFGQSKIPYGFENLQSSQNRLSFDRNDPLNSAVANERDIAAIFYWAPTKIRKRFEHLVKSGLKGTGDYGVFGFGAFTGQTGNKPEINNGVHLVSRLTYPFELPNGQFIEAGIQAFTGEYTLAADQRSKGVLGPDDFTFTDQRAAASLTIYPQPIGFQAEYNIGKGPEFNTETKTIESRNLDGGYALVNAKINVGKQLFYPYVRAQFYNGGKKHELDARSYKMNEYEGGIEWSPIPNFEFTAAYVISDRKYVDLAKMDNHQKGNFLRLQVQFNY